MPPSELLGAPASRRGVLRTGAKVAYVTPLVLASVRAVPALADTITADASEDHTEQLELKLVTNIITGTTSTSSANIQAAIAADNAFLNTFVQLTSQVVPQSQWGTTLIFQGAYGAPVYAYSTFTFNNSIVPVSIATPNITTPVLPPTPVATVQDAINYLTLLVDTLNNALNEVVGKTAGTAPAAFQDLNNISNILNSAPPPINTLSQLGVEEDIENGLINLSGGTFS